MSYRISDWLQDLPPLDILASIDVHDGDARADSPLLGFFHSPVDKPLPQTPTPPSPTRSTLSIDSDHSARTISTPTLTHSPSSSTSRYADEELHAISPWPSRKGSMSFLEPATGTSGSRDSAASQHRTLSKMSSLMSLVDDSSDTLAGHTHHRNRASIRDAVYIDSDEVQRRLADLLLLQSQPEERVEPDQSTGVAFHVGTHHSQDSRDSSDGSGTVSALSPVTTTEFPYDASPRGLPRFRGLGDGFVFPSSRAPAPSLSSTPTSLNASASSSVVALSSLPSPVPEENLQLPERPVTPPPLTPITPVTKVESPTQCLESEKEETQKTPSKRKRLASFISSRFSTATPIQPSTNPYPHPPSSPSTANFSTLSLGSRQSVSTLATSYGGTGSASTASIPLAHVSEALMPALDPLDPTDSGLGLGGDPFAANPVFVVSTPSTPPSPTRTSSTVSSSKRQSRDYSVPIPSTSRDAFTRTRLDSFGSAFRISTRAEKRKSWRQSSSTVKGPQQVEKDLSENGLVLDISRSPQQIPFPEPMSPSEEPASPQKQYAFLSTPPTSPSKSNFTSKVKRRSYRTSLLPSASQPQLRTQGSTTPKARSMMDGGSLGYAMPAPRIPSPLCDRPVQGNGELLPPSPEPVNKVKKRFSFGINLGRNREGKSEKRRTLLTPPS